MRTMLLAFVLVLSACTPATAGSFYDTPASGGGATVLVDTLATIEAAAAACTEGDLGFPTDSQYTLVCDDGGGSYRYFWGGLPAAKPPSTGWTDINGSICSTLTSGARKCVLPAAAGVGYEGERRGIPVSGGESWYALIRIVATGTLGEIGGGYWQTSDGKFVNITQIVDGFNVQKYTNRTTFSAHYHAGLFTGHQEYVTGGALWIGIEDDGTTNRTIYLSPDRITWQEIEQHTRTDHLTADAIWWGGYTNNANAASTVLLVDYEEGAGTLPTALP